MAVSLSPIEFHLPTVSSTNDYAQELLETYPYVFVTALHQTAGRGRKGRVWHGDAGMNAYVSIGQVHQQGVITEELASYMPRASLAMIETLRQFAPEHTFRIKYPNDVQVLVKESWSKIGGAIVEHQWQGNKCLSTVVGMGVNIQQTEFPETINQDCTSLSLLGYHTDVTEFIQALKRSVSDIRTLPWPDVHRKWVHELDILGKSIAISGSTDSWIVTKILDDGRLTARNDSTNHERTISDGDSIRYGD